MKWAVACASRKSTHLISRKHRLVKILCDESVLSAGPHPCTLATHLAVNVGDLLDRAPLAGSAVPDGDDEPIRALAEFLHELVLAVDGEGAVERLERVSLHLAMRWAKVKNSL
jgi:hypothetical protein